MINRHQNVIVGDETLSTAILSRDISTKPDTLILHGAGVAQKKLAWPLVERLTTQHRAVITFDFSGHGESSSNLPLSLSKRVREAEIMVNNHRETIRTVIAFSMSGYIALHLLKRYSISKLVLFAPAIYSVKAFNVPFGSEFSNIIREKNSWVHSDVNELLDEYSGDLLIFVGENDDVIPREVIDTIYDNATNAKSKKIQILPGVGHKIAHTMQTDMILLNSVSSQVVTFLNY